MSINSGTLTNTGTFINAIARQVGFGILIALDGLAGAAVGVAEEEIMMLVVEL